MIRTQRTARTTRGFTLIEMSCVIAIMFVVAALIMPDFVTMRRSRALQDLKAAIHRLPIEAANESRARALPARIVIENDTLILQYVPLEDDPVEVKRVELSSLMSIQGVRQGGEAVDTGSWNWQVYPDGSAVTAAIVFKEGSNTLSLVLERDGQTQWVSGEPPDTSDDEWDAGEIEYRESS